MKNKKRLIGDLVLAVALGLCMAYTFTGGLIHEILGILLLAGMLVHLIRRRKYYRAAFRAIRKKKLNKTSAKISLIINLVMIVATAVMLITSFAISHELFFFLNSAFTGYDIWRLAHVVCAIILVICAFVHICLHAKMYVSVIRQLSGGRKAPVVIWRIVSRVAAFAVAALILGVSVENLVEAVNAYDAVYASELIKADEPETTQAVKAEETTASKETTVETTAETTSDITIETTTEEVSQAVEIAEIKAETEADNEPAYEEEQEEEDYLLEDDYEEADYEEEYVEEEYDEEEYEVVYDDEPEPEPVMSLSDYLGGLYCSGCGRHCCLLSPNCGKGRTQAANAEAEYYEIYGA